MHTLLSISLFLLALPLTLVSALPHLVSRDVIQSGMTYKITNFASGTVVDLSAADNTTIMGYPDHDGLNQHWKFQWTNLGWTIQNAAVGTYVGLNGPAANGTDLVAVASAVGWDIWPDSVNPAAYRFFVHGTKENWDLTDFGNSTPGTPVQLWQKWSGSHQTWLVAP